MKRLITATLTVLLGLATVLVSAPTATAATGCVWLRAEARGNDLQRDAGHMECESWSNLTRVPSGVNVATTCTDGNYRVVLTGDWAYYCKMNAWSGTTTEPPITVGTAGSKARRIANTTISKAAAYGLTLQFSRVDEAGRAGCPAAHPNWLASTYSPSSANGRPGRGLIRIGLGDDPAGCLRWWGVAHNHWSHEGAHALIERTCGTTRPPAAGDRVEPVTGAYARLFLGNTDSDGQTSADEQAARAIEAGNCG